MGIEDREDKIAKAQEIESLIISNHYNKIANKRNVAALVLVICVMLIFAGLIFYAKHTFDKSSGVFKVATDHKTNALLTNLIIDPNHYFDDRVALVQSGSTKNLTLLLTHTTISYQKREDSWNELTTELGYNDIQSNLEHVEMDELMIDRDIIRQMSFKFTNGIPLVIKPHFPLGTTEDEIVDDEIRNTLDVVKWTLETEGVITIKTLNRDVKKKVSFNFDVIPTHPSYKADTLKISRMSLWEATR